jgi:hypothetical protein
MPPAEIERFGGPAAFADAVDGAVDDLAAMLDDPEDLRALLLE